MGALKQLETGDIMQVIFKNEERMQIQEHIHARDQKIYMAMLAGNNYHSPVRIIFNTDEGAREIRSRIWATTDRFLVLKGWTFIPIHSVIDVMMDED
jgi:uncharacterized protein (UPF0248 family)